MRWLLLAALCGMAGPAWATDVVVRVLNVRDPAGLVEAQVCRTGEWMKDGGCAMTAKVPARAGMVDVLVRGVPPGTYAVVAFHDRNGDGEVGQNFLGIPNEGVGFSRHGVLILSEPSFKDAAVVIGGARAVVEIKLAFE